jgi:hypothetical protein
MGNLLQVKQRFIVVATVLSVFCLGLLAYLFLAGSSAPSLATLQKQRDDLQRDVARWENSNPDKTRADLKKFYSENLPTRSSQISERVDKLISDSGVAGPSVHYPPNTSYEKSALPDIEEIKIETNVTGDYGKVARFINALEQDKMLFIIDKISLSGQQGGLVSLQISFSTFLRQTT